ncbi:hypothetical protein B0H16DRAFT_1859557 [Mycena metata]|uniref:Uncharacterized protein n=1 Tax=Mycena metata TaxID=1033252 RepID=A0AAD7N2K0_9AGAR|nr:hypothetical protein B0H16DRAFT_1859557 [Mycena metata]
MSSFSKFASSALAIGLHRRTQRSYAQVVRGEAAVSCAMLVPLDMELRESQLDSEPEPQFSMAELNAGSVLLPREQTQLALLSRDDAFATVAVSPKSAYYADANGWERVVPIPIGSERRLTYGGEACHPPFPSSSRAMVTYGATSPLEDTRQPLYLEYTAPHDLALMRYLPATSSSDLGSTGPSQAHSLSAFPHRYATHASDYHHPPSQSSKYLTGGQTLQYPRREGYFTASWQSFPPPLSPPSPLNYCGIPTCPAVVPVVRRQKPRRRKFYGPFEACSREDVLPEFNDDAPHSAAEHETDAVDGQTWIEHLRALTEREQSPETPGAAQRSRDEWLEMERNTKARLLATYRRNSGSESPTGLQGLPIVVQVRPVYPEQMWRETVAILETKSESGRY